MDSALGYVLLFFGCLHLLRSHLASRYPEVKKIVYYSLSAALLRPLLAAATNRAP
jgi:hypothetical protein